MSSPSIALRRLDSADVPLFRKLNTLLGHAFGDRETYQGKPPTDSYLEGLLRKEHVIVIVAMAGEQVPGGRWRCPSPRLT